MHTRGRAPRSAQYLALALVIVVAVALSFLALRRDTADKTVGTDNGPSIVESADPTPTPSGEAPGGVPKVKDQRRADFTAGDDLPDGSELVDNGFNRPGLAVSPQGLTHGAVKGRGNGSGFLETELDSDVQSLGVRVVFPGVTSGSVVMVAWQDSLAKSVDDGTLAPPTGMYFQASPGHWAVSKVDTKQEQMAEGTFPLTDGPVEFQLVRDGDTLYVSDPSGKVTTVTKTAIEQFAGPWASWGLLESSQSEAPATIQSVWAG